MTVDDLARVCPPPPAPLHAAGDWKRVEAAWKIELPLDFKELVARYGEGVFGGAIQLRSPLHDRGRIWAELVRRTASLDGLPANLHPWATHRAATICWDMRGAPSAWKVVIHEPARSESFDMDTTTFLTRWLEGSLASKALPPAIDPARFVTGAATPAIPEATAHARPKPWRMIVLALFALAAIAAIVWLLSRA